MLEAASVVLANGILILGARILTALRLDMLETGLRGILAEKY